ncbi:hypothetical protein GGTG_12376 [Gaeumannomyces tritici R3-111a-1]|uniref:SET domain-containing protein n=1 Tax=Gaeumannomyces tritici (strain R3-111a-1) TaxID=644352 RepID=J3PFV1_GAET3|nr:hypothetical protein GGTG_12376 [Gaeumannomyces tritici R3-111a-1]EJT70203.1 hypothetical protein GGTG_12376 [Gaeumannomyces tritici R3-111a-1]
MKPADEERFAALVQWNRAQGGFLHPQVEVYSDQRTGFSLRAREEAASTPCCAPRSALDQNRDQKKDQKQDPTISISPPVATPGNSTPVPEPSPPPQPVPHGDAIVVCPLSTTLSFLNAVVGGNPLGQPGASPEPGSDDAAFPEAFVRATPPHVVGRCFLIQQYLLGRASHWHPYIATLPQPEHLASWALPAFWPDDDAAFLAGTNAAVAAAEMRANAASEARQARRALAAAGYASHAEYTSLRYRWAYCIFTSRSFRPSLVVPATLWEAGLKDRAGCEMDDFSVLMPLFDVGNHDPLAEVAWDANSVPGQCRLVVSGDGAFEPGRQLFNNYGPKTNSELLVAYNFVLPATEAVHNDYVHLRLRSGAAPPGQTVRGDSDGGECDNDNAKQTPRDFLISLRPMAHPSSVVGRKRQFAHNGPGPRPVVGSAFSHVEDALLWELCAPHLRNSPQVAAGESSPAGTLAAVFAEPAPPELEALVSGARELLIGKLGADYERLLGEEPDEATAVREALAEAGGQATVAAPLTGNQALALAYRLQCEQVLKSALTSLDPTIRFEAMDEEQEGD